MESYSYYIGLDISAETYTVSVYTQTQVMLHQGLLFDNTTDGYTQCRERLNEIGITPTNAILCLEATGVYGEQLCYSFASHGFTIAVEPPLKVKRAFNQHRHKTDAVDSAQIAEYAYRFCNQLHLWKPQSDILEQIRTLLTAREQCILHSTAAHNALQSLSYKYVQTPTAKAAYNNTIEQQKENIAMIDQELQRLYKSNDSYRSMVGLLQSIPGVGLILSMYLLAISNGFERQLVARQLASFCGIAPLQHQSGTTVYRKPRSLGSGNATLRKLLFLSSLSNRRNNDRAERYFLRKVAEGKSKRLVINNLENKLLKIICAVIASKQPYIENYCSVNPCV
jgi:transposase